jgi:hypothetical protein
VKKTLLAVFSIPLIVVLASSCLAAQVGGLGPHGPVNVMTIVWDVVIIIGLLIIFGILFYLIDKAPLIPPLGKQLLKYFLLLVGALVVIFFILRFIGIA